MTGFTSSWVSTRSPITMAPPPAGWKASQEPSARAGSIATPSSVTLRSVRGRPNLWTPPGWSAPGLPRTSSTRFQSVSAATAGVARTGAARANAAKASVVARMDGLPLLLVPDNVPRSRLCFK